MRIETFIPIALDVALLVFMWCCVMRDCERRATYVMLPPKKKGGAK